MAEFVPITLTEIREGKRPAGRPIRILCEGTFDLFHIGHVEVLRQAKQAFPDVFLVVGVNTDEDVIKYKGGRTVMSFEERRRAVLECKYVDEVVENQPFYFNIHYVNKIQCDLVAHDDIPYNTGGTFSGAENGDFYLRFKRLDRFLTTQRTEGISTTNLIQRILNSHKEYVERNEKRGAIPPSSTNEIQMIV
ncbi:unnamed protein product, partial [Mesorhabditis belari]|uniref:choline-phosphate cytidylyltransferase n=1 Tax=Mesorhabditis belari TaxID=2138241 RepID=A0AAF3J7P9_9BILA